MSDSIVQYFKSITPSFLDKDWKEGFDIFYKVGTGTQAKFLKFGEYTPDSHQRLCRIMEEGNHQQFFIHETDLLRYYRECLLKNLRLGLLEGTLPPRQVFQKVYDIGTRILGDYLEINASERLLRALDPLPGYLVEALAEDYVSIPWVYSWINKEGGVHTHCMNVGLYSLLLARELDLDENEQREICQGGMLADIGKKFVPPDIIMKEGSLTDSEYQAVRKHPSYGRKVLNDMKCYSEIVLRMAGEHHENFDGTGYPHGYRENKISFHARLCKIMDVFAALTSKRSFSERLTPVQALSIIKNDMPGQFDPKLLQSFFRSLGPR